MTDNSMNFTGKSTLTDAEFSQYYEKLWEKSPHKNNWPSEQEIAERKREGAKRYNSEAESVLGTDGTLISVKGCLYSVPNGDARTITRTR